MRHIIADGKLTITIDDEERDQLREAKTENEDFDSDAFMVDFLEPLTANSELDWTDAQFTGDLTDAPMLAIHDEDHNVTERWAFMDYQVISVQQRLLDHGKAVFVQ